MVFKFKSVKTPN